MRASRNIYAPNLNLEYLVEALTAWYRTEKYDVERSDSGRGSVHLRCCRPNDMLGFASPLRITMRQQDVGLTVDIKVGKWARPILISALGFWAIMALLGLAGASATAGCSGVLFLGAIAFCVLCVLGLLRQNKMSAKSFTVIEQFTTARYSISPSSPVAAPQLGSRIVPPVQQTGHYRFAGGQGQTRRPPVQPSGRDEPIGSFVPGMPSVGASSPRMTQRSARDEPIEPPIPDTISSNSASPADDLVISAFPHKESTKETSVPSVGATARACSCGEKNPPDANFCEGCGERLPGLV